MRVLDLTKPEDILVFGRNYAKYKDQVSLPKEVSEKIEVELKAYKEGDITSQELASYITEIVSDYIETLEE